MTKIYKSMENGILVEKASGLSYMSFVDTGLKFFNQKVYKGYMFFNDNENTMFAGYYHKEDIMQLDTRRNSKKLERKIGRTFTSFAKSNKFSWSEWFENMSNDSEICSGRVEKQTA